VFTDLIELARVSAPVKLKPMSTEQHATRPRSTWRPESKTTLWQVLQKKERLERWNEQRDDLIKRARLATRPHIKQRERYHIDSGDWLPRKDGGLHDIELAMDEQGLAEIHPDGVRVVQS
jgi:hypothetical protein